MSLVLSIIIPLYNKQGSIKSTIESILSQEYNDFEIVVVDDGSTDKSVQVVKSISDDRIHLYQKENGGPASARNYGVKMAKGKWVLFLDSDDTLVDNMLVEVINNIHRKRFVDVFTYNQYYEINGQRFLRVHNYGNGYILFPFLSYYFDEIYPGPGRTVVKREIMLKEPFREDLRRHEDTENTFRLMRKYRFYACPQPLFNYNQDTLAASCKRDNYREDFLCIMEPKGKSLFEQMAMLKLYNTEAKWIYPDVVKQIYGNTFHKKYLGRTKKCLTLYKKYIDNTKVIINKLFNQQKI